MVPLGPARIPSQTYAVMECCLVAPFLCFRTQGHFDGESSLPSICFCRVMSASSSMAGASARQMFDLPTMGRLRRLDGQALERCR